MLADMNETIKTLALENGVPPYAIRKWKHRGAVPHKYRLSLLNEAGKRGLELAERDFVFSAQKGRKKRKAA